MAARLLLRDRPSRAIALVASSHVLIFRPSSPSDSRNESTSSLHSQSGRSLGPRCIVELSTLGSVDLSEYKTISYSVYGTLGLITIDNDVFLCLVSGTTKAATVRPGETVQKILSVDFRAYTES